jgi:hypothetical protein
MSLILALVIMVVVVGEFKTSIGSNSSSECPLR